MILDSRHKTDGFDSTIWGQQLKKPSIEKFEQLFKTEYYSDVLDKTPSNSTSYTQDKYEDLSFFNSVYLDESNAPSTWRNELTKYYESPRVPRNINILDWWKTHESVYPNLARMARDILSILASSGPVERLFSECALVMTTKRTSLKCKNLKNLVCINSWSRSSLNTKICEINL